MIVSTFNFLSATIFHGVQRKVDLPQRRPGFERGQKYDRGGGLIR
jgi:hypothetical protein